MAFTIDDMTGHDRALAELVWDACVRTLKYEDGSPVEFVELVNPFRREENVLNA